MDQTNTPLEEVKALRQRVLCRAEGVYIMKSLKGLTFLVGVHVLATAAVAGIADEDPALPTHGVASAVVAVAPTAALTRSQVREELAQAQRTGDMPAGEFESIAVGFQPGMKLNQVHPRRYAVKR